METAQTDVPVRPCGHSQKKDATLSWQVAPCEQAALAQSSMFSLQSSPVQPFTHTQWKPPMVLWHVPPFWQAFGESSHSSTSSVQYWPERGGRQGSHVKCMLNIYYTVLLLLLLWSTKSSTGPVFVAVAVVGVDAVDTPASILTGVLGAVVNVMLTRLTREPCERQRIHVQYTSKSLSMFMCSSD